MNRRVGRKIDKLKYGRRHEAYSKDQYEEAFLKMIGRKGPVSGHTRNDCLAGKYNGKWDGECYCDDK